MSPPIQSSAPFMIRYQLLLALCADVDERPIEKETLTVLILVESSSP